MSNASRSSVTDAGWEPGNQPGQPPQFAGEVRRLPLLRQAGLAGVLDATLAIVQFISGARTHWHRHPHEQILVVVQGECHFGTEDGATGSARAGQTIRLPGGQRHWHGAAPGTTMAHLSVTHGGATEWFEPVS